VTLRGHRAEAIKALDVAEKEGGMGKDEVVRLKAEVQKYIDEGNDALMKSLEKKEMEISQ
jgi:ribosome recycling factor